jgi:hypothetical protein
MINAASIFKFLIRKKLFPRNSRSRNQQATFNKKGIHLDKYTSPIALPGIPQTRSLCIEQTIFVMLLGELIVAKILELMIVLITP